MVLYIDAQPVRRRFRFALLAVCFALAVAAQPVRASAADAAGFMNDLLNEAIAVLNAKASTAERRQRFAQLFHADFDGPAIARFVLGRYWRTASPDERQEFLKLFDDYVVLVYSTRLADFSGEKFKVRGSRADADATIVSTDIVSPGAAQPIQIDWRLVGGDHGYKITDVVVGGVSMMVTERSEFASVIQRHGGQVQGLLALMREKTASAQ